MILINGNNSMMLQACLYSSMLKHAAPMGTKQTKSSHWISKTKLAAFL